MKNKIFLFIFLSFLVFFIVMLIAEEEGYYKNRNEKAKIMTEEQIKRFEEDISEGKDIDLSTYELYNDVDYSNNVTSNIYKVSLKLESAMHKILKIIFKSTSKMVSD